MKYYNIKEVLDALSATTKKTEKEEILCSQVNDTVLKEVCLLTCSPYVNFYIKKIPDYRLQPEGFGISLSAVIKHLDVLYNRQLTGNAAIEWLARQFESLGSEDAYVLERIIQKSLDCGVSTSTINKVWPGLVPSYPCMLASSYSDKNLNNITFPATIQEKCDGARFNAHVTNGVIKFYSRNGKEIDLKGQLDSDINLILSNVATALNTTQNLVLDGELLVVDENSKILPRKTGNGILSKAGKGTITEEEASRVRYVIWDVIPATNFHSATPYDVPYTDRFSAVQDAVQRASVAKLMLPITQEVNTLQEGKEFFTRMLKLGKEGAILKNKYSIWENKRSKNQVKLKVEIEFEMKVVAAEEGTGKYVGKLGALLCSTEDGGITVSVGSGFSDAQRKEYWETNMKGKIITIKGNEVIEDSRCGDKSIFLPIFIEVREDKTVANTLDEVETLFREAS